MLLKKLNQLFPFFRLLRLLVLFALVLQVIIITYNHFSGYYTVPDFADFLRRLIYSSFFTVLAGLLIAYPNLIIIHFLNVNLPWSKHALRRIILQFTFTVLFAIIVSTLITLIVHWIDAYEENLYSVLISNALIFAVVNIVLMTILEALIFFNDSKQSGLKAEKLEKELSQIKFEVLKNQINPHFMFNSLNVLSGLIEDNATKAQQFVDEFSQIYRYVLETIEKPVVSLNDELSFVRSYIFLQQIRYGEDLSLKIDIPADSLHSVLPPLSLQTVLENAIKHNVINTSKPLKIEIFHENQWLLIRNNIQVKRSLIYSSGLGQKNMIKRYEMVSEHIPEFRVEAKHYLVRLPLIKSQ